MTKKVLTLAAQLRTELGKKAEAVRDAGRIPAVVYGGQGANLNISLAYNECEKLYTQAGESSLVDLVIENGTPIKTLIHEVQHSPMTNRISHVDFFRVTMTEKLTTTIPFEFIGESKAVKEQAAVLVKNIVEVDVRCLPQDLVSEIIVDLSLLQNLEDSISLSDIVLPSGIEILHHEDDDVVVVATPPMSEAELAKLEAEDAVKPAEIPVVEDKSKKEEEGK